MVVFKNWEIQLKADITDALNFYIYYTRKISLLLKNPSLCCKKKFLLRLSHKEKSFAARKGILLPCLL